MTDKTLTDGEYVLIDGRAWFTCGKISIRITTLLSGDVCVAAYDLGGEDAERPIADMVVQAP